MPLVGCGLVRPLRTGGGEFSTRLLTALRALPTPHVLYMQERSSKPSRVSRVVASRAVASLAVGSRAVGSSALGSSAVGSRARESNGTCCKAWRVLRMQEDSWLTGESEASSGALLCALALLDAGHFDGVRP